MAPFTETSFNLKRVRFNEAPPRKGNLHRALLSGALFLAVFALRLSYCFQAPIHTTDILRNLGFSSQLFHEGAALYFRKASDYRPAPWSYYWPETGFIYPPVTLIFFASLSLLKSIAWAKIALTLCDLASSYILAVNTSRWLGLLLFASPALIWWTSHEGQFESLHLLLMLLCGHFALRKRWFLAGLMLALGIQTKLFSVLLFPFLLGELGNLESERAPAAKRAAAGFVGGFLPFLPFYHAQPKILLLPFLQKTPVFFNTYGWNFLRKANFGADDWLTISWNAFFSCASLATLLLFAIRSWKSPRRIFPAIGPLSFWVVVKSLHWAFPWYAIQLPGLLFPLLREKKLFLLLMALSFLQDFDAGRFIMGIRYGNRSSPEVVTQLQKCLTSCEFGPQRSP